jgi:hypothetical protein
MSTSPITDDYARSKPSPERWEWISKCAEIETDLTAAQQRIKHLEDIINRAHLAFFSDSSDRKVSIAMHRILDEEVRKESQ